VTFTFEDEGSFTVILRVTDDDGAVSELFFSVNVRNLAPTGVATVDRTEAEVAKIFNFAALDLQDTPNDVEGLTVTWSFGDGSLGTGVTTTHRYDEPGDYTVTMTVRDDDGATYDGFLYITVTEEGGMMSGRTATLAIAAAVAAIVIALITLMFLRRIGTTEDEEVDDEGESDPTVSEERVEEKVSPEDPVEDEGVG
nr:PKD domain-containing protein [Thermoplasmata archaeon]NIS14525.1 PKD domain-containing protein [Thermoplasmata archaeon]NIS20058.1 PKD domain-containing protein [Thermoplasmata archaeon]NIT77271.1 PKD domain-containing protein [Thermoplasmata archaeon]NIU49160.1 PKD domain-containing protein [Thermoplasmata archaeon]